MPRPKRADEGGGLYHALNRGNARAQILYKPEDYDAFERIVAGKKRFQERMALPLVSKRLTITAINDSTRRWQCQLQ